MRERGEGRTLFLEMAKSFDFDFLMFLRAEH